MASTLEMPLLTRARTGHRWWWAAPLLVALIIYLVLALWLARTKAPWYDEGQYANPAFNLAFHGNMGSNVVQPSGIFVNAYFKGIQKRTYITVPTNFVALAGWFRIFGFSVFSARAYSIGWGVITLLALFYIVQRSFPDRRVAQIATLFTAIDFIFLWSSADARMDAAANALALCSVATYLHFREKSFDKAVIGSQVLGAAAVFTHPNAALVVLVTAILAWRFDRGRIRTCGWRGLALAALPYFVFGILWSFYILQSPADFRAQFLAQVAGHHSERFTRLLHPDIALGAEIDRHLAAYCIGGLWGGVMKGWMAIVPLLYIPALIWFLQTARRGQERLRIFLTYTVAMVLGITFLNGFKGYFYLIYVTPLYNAVFAAWLFSLWERRFEAKCLAVTVSLAFVLLQLSSSILHIRADEFHRDYVPAVQELVRDRAQGKSIIGTAALGFGMDYKGFSDDVRLGMYSGLDPDVIVMDRAYRMYTGFFEKDEGPVFVHIVAMLSSRYRLAAQHGSFWIFERGKGPWMDVSKIGTAEKGKRAEYFFRLIFDAYKMLDRDNSSL